MIIDCHNHIYPPKISRAAVESIGKFYNIEMDQDGTVETLIKRGKQAGVSKFLVHSVATTSQQVESINNFIHDSVERFPNELIGFMALHQDFEDIFSEMDRAEMLGLKGIKLHPDFQKFDIDDPKMYPLYDAASGRFPILFHMGDTKYSHSDPKRLAKVLKDFPNLQVIGAHFAGYSQWEEAVEVLKGGSLWVDTSSSSFLLSDEQLKSLISHYGSDYVLFATDYPMWTHKNELKRLEGLNLSADVMDKILYKNAETLLNL